MGSTILVTGAAGFVGLHLVKQLLGRESIAVGGDPGQRFERIVISDRATPLIADPRIKAVPGNIADPEFAASLVTPEVNLVFHLAGVVSGAAEADLDLGLAVNLDGTRALMDASRALGSAPRFVFTSSIAAFGTPLPARIDDNTPGIPSMSYGTQKRMCEMLIDDYTRRGHIDGRALRLPGIVVRPPNSNGALSAFNSDLIREPVAGREVTIPISRGAGLWMMSVRQAAANLLHAASLAPAALGAQRTVNLPAVTVSAGEVIDALERAGVPAKRLVRHEVQPAIEAKFGGFTKDFHPDRARALGFTCDAGIAAIVADYIEHGS
jgi:nucleoside-diphosphate-sugar epimerase